MIISKFETGHPFTIALQTAFESGLIDREKEEVLKREIKEMVAESAYKFTNTKSIKSIREALDVTLGILSLSIMHQSEGSKDPYLWAQIICEDNLKKIAGSIIPFIKDNAERIERGRGTEFVHKSGLADARSLLLRYAKSKKNNQWTGYEELLRSLRVAEIGESDMELTKWLISFLVKIPFEKWLAINKNRELEGNYPFIDTALNNLLFRHCVQLPITSEIILTAKDFLKARTKYESDKDKWLTDSRQRYDTLVAKIPQELHESLLWVTDTKSKRKKDWFERMLSKGPPSLPKDMYLDTTGKFQAYHI